MSSDKVKYVHSNSVRILYILENVFKESFFICLDAKLYRVWILLEYLSSGNMYYIAKQFNVYFRSFVINIIFFQSQSRILYYSECIY